LAQLPWSTPWKAVAMVDVRFWMSSAMTAP
jgi:hypothetical protein